MSRATYSSKASRERETDEVRLTEVPFVSVKGGGLHQIGRAVMPHGNEILKVPKVARAGLMSYRIYICYLQLVDQDYKGKSRSDVTANGLWTRYVSMARAPMNAKRKAREI